MTIRKQLRLLSLVALIIVAGVMVSTVVSLGQLRQQFTAFQSWQASTQALTEFKASALGVSRDDPIMMETGAHLKAADDRIQKLQKLINSNLPASSLRKSVNGLFVTWNEYIKGFRGALKIAEDSPQDALNIPDALYKLKLAPMIKRLDKQVSIIQQSEDVARNAMVSTISRVLWLVLVPMMIGGALLFTFQMMFSHRLNKRLNAISEAGTRLGEGDLSSRLPGPYTDEIGQMTLIINNFIEKIESIVRDVQSSAGLTRHSAEQLGQMSNSVASNAQVQSDRILQVGSAVEQMAATASETTQNVNNATEAAHLLHTNVRHGNQVGQDTVAALRRIDEVVGLSSARLLELSSSVALIEKVSSVIRDIAEQTNLLALNAAIEAARAGEQGRGFAVVADEVRQLSHRTTLSTGEISTTVNDIRRHAEDASMAMSEVSDEVGRGVEHGREMEQVLGEIDNSVQLVTTMMEQIALAAEQQSQVTTDIGNNIEAVADISVTTARDMANTHDAVTALETSAEGLYQMVDQLQTSGVTTEDAVA